MAGPKMGNTYPSEISSYPNWVAHETPYTAEWGNSVGFEFHLIEYELGESPRGSYNSVKDRLDSFPEFSGFNYWARGYYMYTIGYDTAGTRPIYFMVAEHDKDNVFDLVGRRNITAKITGWYHVVWNQFIEVTSGTYPCAMRMQVKRSRGGGNQYVGQCNRIFASAGFYSFRVDVSVHLEAGEYIWAELFWGTATMTYTRAEYDSNIIDFSLITTDPYDVK